MRIKHIRSTGTDLTFSQQNVLVEDYDVCLESEILIVVYSDDIFNEVVNTTQRMRTDNLGRCGISLQFWENKLLVTFADYLTEMCIFFLQWTHNNIIGINRNLRIVDCTDF